MKIQTKTTLLFTSLTVTVFVILIVTVYYFSNEFAYNDFYKRLELRARIAAKFRFEEDHVSTESFKQIQKQYLERLPDEESYTVKLAPDGKLMPPISESLDHTYLEKVRDAAGATVYNQQQFLHFAGVLYHDETGDFLVIESALNTYGNEIIKRLRNILLVTLFASIAIIYSVGRYFSRRTFRPFRYITTRVKNIGENNLHLRLEQHDGSDEIAELIRTFNNMLDRLETAFETQNNFVSNASHELRTPLTAIVAEADYALSKNREADVYRQSLQHIIAQSEKLQKLTGGLLSLAHTGFDGKKQQWENIRIDQLVFDVKENVDAILPQNDVHVNLLQLPENEADGYVFGNYDLLRTAIGNVVLNACKYSDNKKVLFRLKVQNATGIIEVIDLGIGIPATELRHIYDPFFRASNTVGYEGYGIGMPLSNNIVRIHGGKIAVDSIVNEGTKVTIVLPLVKAP